MNSSIVQGESETERGLHLQKGKVRSRNGSIFMKTCTVCIILCCPSRGQARIESARSITLSLLQRQKVINTLLIKLNPERTRRIALVWTTRTEPCRQMILF